MKWYAGQYLPRTHARPSFSEAWFHSHYGFTFGEKYHFAYKKLEPLEYIEVGWRSDVAAVRRAFPNSTLDLMINIQDLQNMSRLAMRESIADMVRQACPICCLRDVWVADIGPEVSDEKVLDFVEAVDWAVGRIATGGAT